MTTGTDCTGPGCIRTTRKASGLCDSHDAQRRRGVALTVLGVRRSKADVRARDEHGRKHCVRCDGWKQEADFSAHKTTADKLAPWCRRCTHLAKYNLTPQQYDELSRSRNGRCHSCSVLPAAGLVVDHDHACCDKEGSCGRCVRGLLCDACNKILGLARDDVARLNDAVAYLQRAR